MQTEATVCKMHWGTKQIYYATCFFKPTQEAADVVELLYCTRDKVGQSAQF